MFEDKTVEIYTYLTEQIIADKLYVAVHFQLVNSGSKDVYDLYTMFHVEKVNNRQLNQGARNTLNQNETSDSFKTNF